MARKRVPALFPLPDAVLSLSLDDNERTSDYATSYPHLVRAVQGRVIDPTVYVQITHMVYGWMPTVLKLTSQSTEHQRFSAEASVLESIRLGVDASASDLTMLKASINNSIVGVSKLLHFLRPERYAIWDSKVYSYLRSQADPNWNRKVDHEQVNSLAQYESYMNALSALVSRPEFRPVHQKVNDVFQYEVTALRAAEVLMYANAP